MRPLREWQKTQTELFHEYVGIASDEPERLKRLLKSGNASSPLADFGITEEMALGMCREKHLLSPIYQTQARSGCWFCHNARVGEMRMLYRDYPELWVELHEIQKISENSFTKRASIFDLEERFKKELADEAIPNDI